MSEYNDDEWDYVSPPSPTIKGVWMTQEAYDAQAAQIERLKGLLDKALVCLEEAITTNDRPDQDVFQELILARAALKPKSSTEKEGV